jgi:hypothetical protein
MIDFDTFFVVPQVLIRCRFEYILPGIIPHNLKIQFLGFLHALIPTKNVFK